MKTPIDIKSMELGELVVLQEKIQAELKVREAGLFKEKCQAIIDAIEDLCDAFPYASWDIEYEDEDAGWQSLDLLRKYSVTDLVSCISR